MFRKTLFWIHLVAGIVAGLVIAVMSATGVALAFEKDLVAWAERDAQTVAVPSDSAPRLPLDDLLKRFRTESREARPSAITVSASPEAAVAVTVGRDLTYYLNPYTGEIRRPRSTWMRDTLRVMENAHRWLALDGDARATGRAITGACNLSFFILGVTGLYLWWPRRLSWRALRPSVWFVGGAKGKARDWNWHNTIGFWSLPILLILTASGIVMSYRWANNLVYQLAGEAPPTNTGPGGPGGSEQAQEIAPPTPGARPAGYAAHLLAIQGTTPNWQTVTFRLGGNRRPEGTPQATRENIRTGNRSAESNTAEPERRSGARPVTATVRARDDWPSFATTTLTLDPYSSQVLKTETLADATKGRRARMWLRFLHTGEALGLTGKIVAALASLGGLVLVYTGFAMAIRRARGGRGV